MFDRDLSELHSLLAASALCCFLLTPWRCLEPLRFRFRLSRLDDHTYMDDKSVASTIATWLSYRLRIGANQRQRHRHSQPTILISFIELEVCTYLLVLHLHIEVSRRTLAISSQHHVDCSPPPPHARLQGTPPRYAVKLEYRSSL